MIVRQAKRSASCRFEILTYRMRRAIDRRRIGASDGTSPGVPGGVRSSLDGQARDWWLLCNGLIRTRSLEARMSLRTQLSGVTASNRR
jgi:hypothetical protein